MNDKGSHKTMYRKISTAPPEAGQPHDQNYVDLPKGEQRQNDFPPNELLRQLSLCRSPSIGTFLRQGLLQVAVSEGQSLNSGTFSGMISKTISDDATGSLYAPPLACYTLWRGRRDNNSSMIDASHQLYIRGLSSTQMALRDPLAAYSNTTLAACNALGLYEALECPDRNMMAYRWHRAACARLVQLRGPAAHQHGAGHELFVNIRLFAVRLKALSRQFDWLLTDAF